MELKEGHYYMLKDLRNHAPQITSTLIIVEYTGIRYEVVKDLDEGELRYRMGQHLTMDKGAFEVIKEMTEADMVLEVWL